MTTGTQATPGGRVNFPHLDALRTLAFAMVFLRHTFRYVVEEWDAPDVFQRIAGVATSGAYGVSLFFVLSGFLITYLMLDEIANVGVVRVLPFYARRVLRIWPLYIAVLLVGLALYPGLRAILGMANPFAHEWWWYALFLSNFDVMNAHHRGLGESTLMMVAITWSVAIEEQFYLVWPWVLRCARLRWLRILAFSAVALAAAVFRWFEANDEPALHFHTFAAMGDLAVGALAADLSFGGGALRRLLTTASPRVITAGYVVVLAVLMYQHELPAAFGRLLQTVCFAFVILEHCFGPHVATKASRLPGFTKMGRYTYGLYMLHPIALTMVEIVRRRAVPSLSGAPAAVVMFAIGLPLSIALALASYHMLEKPFLNVKARFA